MKHNRIFIMTLALTFISAAAALAWGPRGGMHQRGYNSGYNAPPCAYYETSLTTDQRQQVDQLREQFLKDTADLRIELNAKSEKLSLLLDAADPDKRAIKNLTGEISQLKQTLMEKRVDHQLAVKAVAPELNTTRGFGLHHGYGTGYGMGRGFQGPMGPGYGGPGNCWR
ncbi:MAG: periplasmic heavy metal sensor [Thermodesulfobacteriota bacterium]|nr:periplasmic heavy metal sensor [Thermodesulfobacteriota bacterium]